MKGLTDTLPKCLLALNGKPLLDRQLSALQTAGIVDIALVTGYRREALSARGLPEFYNPRWQKTNMVSSLACACTWLLSGPCIVSYSDIFYDARAVNLLMGCPAALAITYDPAWRSLWTRRFGDPLLDAETFCLKPDGTLAEIGHKPSSVDDIEGQYMGLLRFTPEGWAEVARIRSTLDPAERDALQMTGVLQRVIEAGRIPIAALPYNGHWGEVDTPDDLKVYR